MLSSPANRLLKLNPTISSSISTPDLTNLEAKFSLSRSTDDDPPIHPPVSLSLNLDSVTACNDNNLLHPAIGVASSSAPGSLQSSPRKSDFVVPLSATPEAVDRPKTLPPKNAVELQKHIKEYEEISKQIKKAMNQEAKDKQKRDIIKSARDKKLLEFRKIWVEEVLPQWEKNTTLVWSPPRRARSNSVLAIEKRDTKKVQDMWRVGLPPSVRGQIWRLSIGNELMITKELFDISVGHAQQTKESMFGSPQFAKLPDGASISSSPEKDKSGRAQNIVPMDELLGKEGTVALVSMLDLPADFPARELFVQGGPMHKQFAELLEGYVAYRPDVGYVPNMSYLVAGLLLNMETVESFISLANFINKPFNLAFYITDRSQMYKYTSTMDSIILTLLPKIHKRFTEIDIAPESYICDWFMTLYLKALPLDIASRVWDLYFLEGEIFLFKVALSLLKMYSHQFESYPRDLCMNMLSKFPKDVSEDTLFETIAHFNLDPKKFQKLMET